MHDRSPTGEDQRSLSRRATEEHRRLHRMLHDLESAEPFAELVARLDGLQPMLEAHFGLEERADDGLLTLVETRAVHLHSEVEKLRADHARLRAELEGLRARAHACPADGQAALRADVASFTGHLHDHETRETWVFVDSWNTDLGAQD